MVINFTITIPNSRPDSYEMVLSAKFAAIRAYCFVDFLNFLRKYELDSTRSFAYVNPGLKLYSHQIHSNRLSRYDVFMKRIFMNPNFPINDISGIHK